MGMQFKFSVKMKGIGGKEKFAKLIDYLKKGKDYEIFNDKVKENFVALSSFGDFLISNSDEAMRKISKEYPDEMICYENHAEGTNVFSAIDALSFSNIYMKNGVDILKYEHMYRPVYSDDTENGHKLVLNLDDFEKELEERKRKIDEGKINFSGWHSVFELPTGHDVFYKKPLQRYYKILDNDINKLARINFDEFVIYFDKSELDIFKGEFEPCDDIKNDDITTGFDDANDEEYIEDLKASASIEEFIEKFNERCEREEMLKGGLWAGTE